MSIVVKGAKLPNNCRACPLRLAWCTERLYMVTRPERCPLEPERTGKWIRHLEQRNIYGGKTIECSECQTKYVVQYIEDERYCRNCGARMES